MIRVIKENGELYIERNDGDEWETLPIIEVLPHALYEVAFYDFYGTAHTVDDAVAMYEEFETAYYARLNDNAKPYC